MRIPRLVRCLSGAVVAALAGVSVCSAVQEEKPLWNGRELLALASAHNPDTCMVMGMCYYYGLGIEQDIQKAEHWYTQGAEGGNTDCMRELAKLYRFGLLVPKDAKKALRYMLQAARAGNESALLMLGWAYLTGQGVAKDTEKAHKLFLNAARRGNADACYWVAWAYRRGVGVEADVSQALQWFGIGAWRGSVNCMMQLADLIGRGQGTKRDLSQARFYLQKAAAQGVAEAQLMLRELEIAENIIPVQVEDVPQPTPQQCWEQYLHGSFAGEAFSSHTQAWLERAVELGHPRAAVVWASERFSVLASPQENARYLPALEKAAASGEASAWSVLASYYNLCLNGEEDMHQISHCVRRYAETSGCAATMLSVMDGYALGAYSKKPDIEKVVEWARCSAEKGYQPARDILPFAELLGRSAQQEKKN